MIEKVAAIVSAFLKRNHVPRDQLPALITSVHESLSTLGQEPTDIAAAPSPFVSIRRSVRPEFIVCLDCGKECKMLKRHLTSAHKMTVDEYRDHWGLPRDYPMVARNYSISRSDSAKATGLGRHGRASPPSD